MKTRFSFFSLIITVLLFMASCHKHRKAVHATHIVNATVEMNKPYQFDLGTLSKRESASITEQAIHYTISETDHITDEHMVYNYMPAMNYTGQDEAVVTIAQGEHHCGEHEGGNGCGYGQCKHEDDDDQDDNTTTYIIKITVMRSGSVTTNNVIAQNNTN